MRELSLVSLPLLLIQLLVFVTAQSDLWIAGIFCPHDQLAQYGAARRLTLLVAMPMQIASMTVLATIAELHAQGRRAELERLLRHTASLAAIPSLGALLLLIVCGGPALTLLFGPFYAQACAPPGDFERRTIVSGGGRLLWSHAGDDRTPEPIAAGLSGRRADICRRRAAGDGLVWADRIVDRFGHRDRGAEHRAVVAGQSAPGRLDTRRDLVLAAAGCHRRGPVVVRTRVTPTGSGWPRSLGDG